MFYDMLHSIGYLTEQLQNNKQLLKSRHYEKIGTALQLLQKIEMIDAQSELNAIYEIVDSLLESDDCDSKCAIFKNETFGVKDLITSVCAEIEQDPQFVAGPM